MHIPGYHVAKKTLDCARTIIKKVGCLVILRQFVVGGVLFATAAGCFALTLGRTRGAALVGQPLEVTVPVRLEADENLSNLCFTADVFYADTQIDAQRVRVITEPAGVPLEAVIRISSAAAVNEPVVTVYLKTGCAQKLTRRYVLLAEVISSLPEVGTGAGADTVVPLRSRTTPVAPPANVAVSAPPRIDASRSPAEDSVATRNGATSLPQVSTSRKVPPIVVKSKGTSVVRRQLESSVASPRLRLDPLELAVERDPTLKATAQLLTAPLEDDPKRAQAAALWRAINAQPADVLRDAQRMADLEKDLQSLREQALRTQTGLGELRTQLQQSERERYANPLVYALISLLVAALAAMAYFWSRSRQRAGGNDWWQGAEERPTEADQGIATKTDTTISSALLGDRRRVTDMEVDPGVNDELFASLKRESHTLPPHAPDIRNTGLSPLDTIDFASSFGGSARAVNAEELFDIQQQADFFVSLGQFEQAIDVLKNHIHENSDTSALAYLDLFGIYHNLGRRDDYALLREDFNRVFNAQVPEYDSYSLDTRGLEAYTVAMSRIEALWPSRKVLGVIEESIFRKPGSDGGEAFDPEAYRELLLLHAIAKEVVDSRSDASGVESQSPQLQAPVSDLDNKPTKFQATRVHPLSAAERAMVDGGYDRSVPRASSRLGIDIDLSVVESTRPMDVDINLEANPKPRPYLVDIDIFDSVAAPDLSSGKDKV